MTFVQLLSIIEQKCNDAHAEYNEFRDLFGSKDDATKRAFTQWSTLDDLLEEVKEKLMEEVTR